MTYSQSIAYRIDLPQFMIDFKQNVNRILLPPLISLKDYINDESNQATVHPAISILLVIVIFAVIKNIYNGLFGKSSSNSSQNNNSSSAVQSQQLSRQLNDLKKQLKGLYSSFNELTKDINNVNNIKKPKIIKQQTQNVKIQPSNGQTVKLWKQLQPLYNSSIESNKKLALYILQTQEQMFKQLKKLKKISRLSASSGRQSTTRSKTSDKKYLQSEISTTQRKNNLVPLPVKQNNMMTHPIIDLKTNNNNKQNHQNIGSSSSLSTSLPQNNHSNTSSILENQKQKQKQTQKVVNIPKTNFVPPVSAMRNVKPPLPRVKPPVITNIIEEENKNHDSGLLIKRADTNQTSPQKNNEQKIKKPINITKKFEEDQFQTFKNEEQPMKVNVKSPEKKQVKHIEIKQQVKVLSLSKVQAKHQKTKFEPQNISVNTPEIQQTKNIEQDAQNAQNEMSSQPIPPPKLGNMKKLNPPTKMNPGRRAPPPPPRK